MAFGECWFEEKCPFTEGRIKDKNNKYHPIKLLIDTGANSCLLPQDILDLLDIFIPAKLSIPKTAGLPKIRPKHFGINFEFQICASDFGLVPYIYSGEIIEDSNPENESQFKPNHGILGMNALEMSEITLIINKRKNIIKLVRD